MLVPKVESGKNSNNKEPFVIEVDEYMSGSLTDCNVDTLIDEKFMNKYIKRIESIIRSSFEYRQYIYILKNEINLTKCKFLKNLDVTDSDFSLEFHHYPFTLYDIVAIHYNELLVKCSTDMSNANLITNPFYIADKITKEHYENKIGLVPLSLTVHELAHNGLMFIPLNKDYVFGNYNEFIKNHSLEGDYISKIEALEKLTKEFEADANSLDLSKLEIHKTFIQMHEATIPQPINICEFESATA